MSGLKVLLYELNMNSTRMCFLVYYRSGEGYWKHEREIKIWRHEREKIEGSKKEENTRERNNVKILYLKGLYSKNIYLVA